MRDRMVGVLALVVMTCLTAEAQQGSTVIEDGTSHDDSSGPLKYAVNVIDRVIPGGAMINDFTQYGAATAGVSQVITYYYVRGRRRQDAAHLQDHAGRPEPPRD